MNEGECTRDELGHSIVTRQFLSLPLSLSNLSLSHTRAAVIYHYKLQQLWLSAKQARSLVSTTTVFTVLTPLTTANATIHSRLSSFTTTAHTTTIL